MTTFMATARKKLLARTWPLGLLAMLAASAGANAAEPSPTTALGWLNDMRHSVASLNYQGVVAYLKDKQVESFQLFHAMDAGKEQERLVAMNSPLREVVRSAEKVACYFPETKTVFIESKPSTRSVLLELPEDLGQLSRHYRVSLKSQEYVTRRLSQVVSIEPQDGYRYARLIWVDTASKLPLKFEMLGENGQVVEQMIFTSLAIEASIPRTDLIPSMPVDNFTRQASQRETLPLDSLHWTLHDVPEGFQIISYTRIKRPPNDRSVEHILLSDGFSSVSIYIEDRKGGMVKDHPKRIGAVNAYSLMIDNYLVTVMGEVPGKTVETIASGLHYHEHTP